MDEVGVCVSWEVKMEIRGEHGKQKVRFDSLKEGEPFYYNSELCMKTSEITCSPIFCGGTIYNCVSLRHGRIMSCSDDAMVGVARVHIEKEY
jgi:hypothetical protein